MEELNIAAVAAAVVAAAVVAAAGDKWDCHFDRRTEAAAEGSQGYRTDQRAAEEVAGTAAADWHRYLASGAAAAWAEDKEQWLEASA
mmetsp:Transcript_22235/g.32745  ORF Transcript_22235/g.32745 Transcript_22235/m.32745 type:complete len:87 (+) Transcript_22235:248-508(+)